MGPILFFLVHILLLSIKVKSLSNEEFSNLAVKTIHSNGRIFDCVDINKQPSLSHPAVNNHTVQTKSPLDLAGKCHNLSQMAPSLLLKKMMYETSSSLSPHLLYSNFGSDDEECPPNTVPVERTKKKDPMNVNRGVQSMYNPSLDENTYYAAYTGHIGIYHGLIATLNVYGVSNISSNQRSGAMVELYFSYPDYINWVNVGWEVDPDYYGDTKPRIFIYWTADRRKIGGCRNFDCPGFVQTSRERIIGEIIPQVSTYDGPQYAFKVSILKDPATKNWMLTVGNITLGYWSPLLFHDSDNYAFAMSWGGFVVSPPEHAPPMGSGHFPTEGMGKACFFSNLLYVDGKDDPSEFAETSFSAVENKPGNYKAGTLFWSGKDLGSMFYFGGPAGHVN